MEDQTILGGQFIKHLILYLGLSLVWMIIVIPDAQASWLIYHKPTFEGQILDIETKKPIEGAAVVAFYYKGLMISLGAGAISTIFKIEEAVTDHEGRFRIPSYTTFLSPWSIGQEVTFIIYKPGYAPLEWPTLLEYRFSGKEKGERSVSYSLKKEIKFRDNVVELPKLETKEDRLKALRSPEGDDVSDYKFQRQFIRLINEERKYLGLEPYKIPSGE
jgi:hypothetical protein